MCKIPYRAISTQVRKAFHAPSFQIGSSGLSNHLLPAKGTLKNFIFVSQFSASPLPSITAPCRVLLRSWTTCSSFQFQYLNSICGHCQSESGRVSMMIRFVGSVPIPALKVYRQVSSQDPCGSQKSAIMGRLCTSQPKPSWFYNF